MGITPVEPPAMQGEDAAPPARGAPRHGNLVANLQEVRSYLVQHAPDLLDEFDTWKVGQVPDLLSSPATPSRATCLGNAEGWGQ